MKDNLAKMGAGTARGAALERLVMGAALLYEREGLAHLERSAVPTVFDRNGQPKKAGKASGDFIGCAPLYDGSSQAILIECKHRPNLWFTDADNVRTGVNFATLPTRSQRERMDAWGRMGALVLLVVECWVPDLTPEGGFGPESGMRLLKVRWTPGAHGQVIRERDWRQYDIPVCRGVYDVLGLL